MNCIGQSDVVHYHKAVTANRSVRDAQLPVLSLRQGSLYEVREIWTYLLNLFKLVHPENTPRILPMAARLLSETRRVPSVLHGQMPGLDVFICKHCADGLFRGRNQILVVGGVAVARDLVQGLVKLFQLGGSGHQILFHHKGRLDLFVPLLAEKVEAVVDERLVEVDAVVGEEEAAVAGDFDACVSVRRCIIAK